MAEVAVVILNYNGRKYLAEFLPTLLTNTPNAKIIVADNASSDDSLAFLSSNFPTVETISLDINYGFAGGYNKALSNVKADYYAIINSDVAVTERWLEPLLGFLEENEGYAAVQPKIRSYKDKDSFEYAGASGGFIDGMGYPYCRGRIFDTIEKDNGQYDDTIDVDWASGACMLIRSSAFNEAGGFDADFFAHMEEIDLCWRLRANKWKLACVPESTVYHVGGGTLDKSSPFKTYLNFKNGLSILVKNLPLNQLLWKLPLRLVLDGAAAIKFGIETSPKHVFAILKAHIHFYMHFGRDFKKRKNPFVSNRGNLLFSYFIEGKKTYQKE